MACRWPGPIATALVHRPHKLQSRDPPTLPMTVEQRRSDQLPVRTPAPAGAPVPAFSSSRNESTHCRPPGRRRAPIERTWSGSSPGSHRIGMQPEAEGPTPAAGTSAGAEPLRHSASARRPSPRQPVPSRLTVTACGARARSGTVRRLGRRTAGSAARAPSCGPSSRPMRQRPLPGHCAHLWPRRRYPRQSGARRRGLEQHQAGLWARVRRCTRTTTAARHREVRRQLGAWSTLATWRITTIRAC